MSDAVSGALDTRVNQSSHFREEEAHRLTSWISLSQSISEGDLGRKQSRIGPEGRKWSLNRAEAALLTCNTGSRQVFQMRECLAKASGGRGNGEGDSVSHYCGHNFVCC